MNSGNFSQRLKNGQQVIGTWLTLPSPMAAEVIASAGLDFAIIDLEHGPHSYSEAAAISMAIEGRGSTPLIRVPENQDWMILRGLEIGTHGLVVPQITNSEEAKSAVRAAKYHPMGHRGFSPFSRSGGYNAEGVGGLAERKNAETTTILLVEGVTGIDNLDSILDVEGIDVIYLGTYDISQSVGMPGETNHPKVVSFVEDCVVRIRDRNIAAGCLAQSKEDIDRWKRIGIQFIAFAADCSLLYNACADLRRMFDE